MGTNFTRPTLTELIEQAQTDIEGELTGVLARLRRRVERALAFAVAGLADGLHGHLSWNADQIIVDTASDAFVVRWAGLFGLSRTPATPAQGPITVTGTGGDMPAGTLWVRLSDGATYSTDDDADDITSETVQLTAVVGGIDGNLAAGQTLSLVSPVADVDSSAVVGVGGLAGGFDEETIEALTDRTLDRIQHPPLGGAPGDHVTWALEVPGVTRAWEYKGVNGQGNPGLGKVAVLFVCDALGSIDDPEGIIPDEDKVAEVQAYLDDRSPAQVFVVAPTPVAFDYAAAITPSGDTGVNDAVEAEVFDMLLRDSEPGGTIALSRLNEAISNADGETAHATSSPTTDVPVSPAFGEMFVYGTATLT